MVMVLEDSHNLGCGKMWCPYPLSEFVVCELTVETGAQSALRSLHVIVEPRLYLEVGWTDGHPS
jgi:hypothetical protein